MSYVNFKKNVFINCPFDQVYYPLLKSLVFTVLYCNFIPRITKENSDSGQLRLDKLCKLIRESKYSIHDLSRLQSQKQKEFFRLNMPFELGLDYAAKKFSNKLKGKKYLILEANPHDYMKAISDINGLDIKNHENNPELLIDCVRSWFIETAKIKRLDGSKKIWFEYNDFNISIFEKKFRHYRKSYDEHNSEKLAKSDIDKMPFPEFVREINLFLASIQIPTTRPIR